MNRTDQAPEPTMEEILASIRLIISDDAKKPPLGRDDQADRPPSKPEAAPASAAPEEDVLDLTDAHVFPDAHPPANAPENLKDRPAAPPTASLGQPEEPHRRGVQEATAEEAEAQHEEDAPTQPEEDQSPPEQDPDAMLDAPLPVRSIWSRREHPASASPASPAGLRYGFPERQRQRGWAEDVQLPVPDRGPVSLMPSQMQTHSEEAADDHEPADEPLERGGDELATLGDKGDGKVAALAESIARSTAGAMDSDELASAGRVDFSKLGEEQKAEVTESFAKAIERENAPRDKRVLPTLLDEVFRQDFIREPEAKAETRPGAESSSVHEKGEENAGEDALDSIWGAPALAFHGAARPQPAREVRNEASPRIAETLPQEKLPAKALPREVESARPAASAPTLEETVRDMLRPLLVQWLDEHMPRILENAIREEIAMRGLSPKPEK